MSPKFQYLKCWMLLQILLLPLATVNRVNESNWHHCCCFGYGGDGDEATFAPVSSLPTTTTTPTPTRTDTPVRLYDVDDGCGCGGRRAPPSADASFLLWLLFCSSCSQIVQPTTGASIYPRHPSKMIFRSHLNSGGFYQFGPGSSTGRSLGV